MKYSFYFLLILVATAAGLKAQSPYFQWARQIGDSGFEKPASLALDAAGNVYVLGNFQQVVDLDPGPGTYTVAANSAAFANDPTITNSFIVKLDPLGNFIWGRSFGGYSSHVAVDAANNVIISGSFQDTCDFDPGPGTYTLTGIGAYNNIFILKLDAQGNFAWAVTQAATGASEAESVVTDAANTIYVTGYLSYWAFTAKLSPSGTFLWTQLVNGGNNYWTSWGSAIDLDATGHVLVAGQFLGTGLDFDPGPGTYTMSSPRLNGYVLKLDSLGNFNWAAQISGGYNTLSALAVDQSGAAYAGGYYTDTVDADPGPNTFSLGVGAAYEYYADVVKLDAAGNFVWAKQMGGPGAWLSVLGMAQKPNSGIYLTGEYNGSAVDFDPGAGTVLGSPTNNLGVFIMTLDFQGNFSWEKDIINNVAEYGASIAVDPNGDIYTMGSFAGSADFDCGPGTYFLNSVDTSNDVYILKMLACTADPSLTVTSSHSVICAGGSATLTASGVTSYSWSTGATTATIVVSPTVTTNYTVTGPDLNNCPNLHLVTETVSKCTGLSLPDGDRFDEMLFPNPNSGYFTVIARGFSGPQSYTLFDAAGTLVEKGFCESSDGRSEFNFSGKNYKPGIYLLRLTTAGNSQILVKFLME